MNRSISAFALVAALGASTAALAQPVASGGPDAKGNAPLKAPHTVNDGAAKPGASSFTQGEARTHILHAGYTSVSNLVKGEDGVWRGTAVRNGVATDVGLDFKGNVSEGTPARARTSTTSRTAVAEKTSVVAAVPPAKVETSTATSVGEGPKATALAHRRRHRPHKASCAQPAPNGAACSGIDRNDNGVSDKEDRAIQAGATP